MGSDEVNILLVDDQPAKLLSYEVILHELGENLVKASSAWEALEHLLKKEVAVVLIDVCMPELDGFQLAAMIREHPRFQNTAFIFISAILSRYGSLWSSIERLSSSSSSTMSLNSASRSEPRSLKRRIPA